jgi:hypothetical protein
MEENTVEVYSEMAKVIFKQFGRGEFEYYHIRKNIPRYNPIVHRKMSAYKYIEVARMSRKARVWKVTDKTVRLVERSCKH